MDLRFDLERKTMALDPIFWSKSSSYVSGQAANFWQAVNVVIYISLAVWDIPVGWKWACFILAGCAGGIGGLAYT